MSGGRRFINVGNGETIDATSISDVSALLRFLRPIAAACPNPAALAAARAEDERRAHETMLARHGITRESLLLLAIEYRPPTAADFPCSARVRWRKRARR